MVSSTRATRLRLYEYSINSGSTVLWRPLRSQRQLMDNANGVGWRPLKCHHSNGDSLYAVVASALARQEGDWSSTGDVFYGESAIIEC